MRRFTALCCAVLALTPTLAIPASSATPTPKNVRTSLIANLRAHIEHVFVVYQENRSFDSYFGTFPGAENLASPAAQTHGFKQYDPIGRQWVTPFRITSSDVSDADHSRPALLAKADAGRMDRYVATEERNALADGYTRANAQRVGLLTMAHEDCDTIPFLWKYAHAFALFDHFFQAMYGPSTPGNIDLIAAQTGQTQWARNKLQAVAANDRGRGVPVIDDLAPAFGPFPGRQPSPLAQQYDLTFANVLLTLAGKEARHAKLDSAAIKDDIATLVKRNRNAVNWGWYQEGFHMDPKAARSSYVAHHNAVQYFGYERQNPYFWNHVHGLRNLLPAIAQHRLGNRSVVIVKGGAHNEFGWKSINRNRAVRQRFQGDDDHPGYADSQLSESLVATVVNAVAHSTYWKTSAILILWDDSEGFYDHVSPPQFERCPDQEPCGDGPRVPAILISPYARTNAIISAPSDHGSFVKFLDTLFGLPPLASLPDEAPYLPEGPRDTNPRLSDLTAAFDPARLAGTLAPVPASAAEIPAAIVTTFPANMSCASLGITPVHIPGENHPPAGFAPRTVRH